MDIIAPPKEVAAILGSNDIFLAHPFPFPLQNLTRVNAFLRVCASAPF